MFGFSQSKQVRAMGGFFLATKGGGALNSDMAFHSAELGMRIKLNEEKKKEHWMKK